MKTVLATLLWLVAGNAFASQPRETETVRLPPQDVFKIELTGEFQSHGDSAGTERLR